MTADHEKIEEKLGETIVAYQKCLISIQKDSEQASELSTQISQLKNYLGYIRSEILIHEAIHAVDDK